MDRPALAAALMLASLAMLGLQDGFVKLLSADMSLWQFQGLRAGFNLLLLVLLTRLLRRARPGPPRRLWAIALRSMLLVSAMVMFFGGIPFLTLAEIAAGLYVFPLFVAILSALLPGERVGPRRILAILTGFAGTLLILRPGSSDFQPVSLMPVGAAFCYAAMILTTRRLCRDESPVHMAYGVSFAFLVLGWLGVLLLTGNDSGPAADWPYLFTGWHAPTAWMIGLVMVCSLLNLSANLGLAKAYQSAESSWLAPFDYSYMVFATFWGFVFWGDVPDGPTMLGMAMIAGAGGYVAWRERSVAPASR